jgi:ABC-type branched-subunit amino acid transport system ATPase component
MTGPMDVHRCTCGDGSAEEDRGAVLACPVHGIGADFDAATATSAETWEEALALAQAWAEGKRSWVNVVHAETPERRQEVVAAMDAQEVVKWSALAVALAQLASQLDDRRMRRAGF